MEVAMVEAVLVSRYGRIQRAERGVVDFGKLFTETNGQKFSLGGVQCKKI